MNNIYKLTAILLITVMLLCSCSTVIETPIQPTPTEEATPTPTIEPTPMPTRIEDIGQIVYVSSRRSLGKKMILGHDYEKNNLPTIQEKLEPGECVVDESVPKNITWNYLGVDFELEYECSGYDGYEGNFTDEYVDLYSTDPYKKHAALRVIFLHGTDQPVQVYYNISKYNPLIDVDMEPTEENFLNIIKLNNEMLSKDFSGYSCKFVIRYNEPDETVTYTDIADIKNTGREVGSIKVYYYPKQVSGYDVITYPVLLVSCNYWNMFYRETDFDEYTEPIEISDSALQYAFQESVEFGEENFEYINEDGDKVDFQLAPTPFIPSETKLDVLNGRLYLVIKIYLVGEWANRERGEYESYDIFYVDYERLQWKMALEGKT